MNIIKRNFKGLLKKAAVIVTSSAMLFMGTTAGLGSMTAMAASWQDSGVTATAYAGGTGTSDSPYQIATAAQLAYLAQKVGSGLTYASTYFELTASVDLSAYDWTPIGTGDYSFSGTFDGMDYKITGMKIGTTGSANSTLADVGLFGSVGTSGIVENVGVVSAAIYSTKAEASVGEIAGENTGTITNCYSTGSVTGGGSAYVGGLAGYNDAGTVINCYTTASVIGGSSASVGGIAGITAGTVTNCYTTGSVTGGGSSVIGGIAGINAGATTNCYATGSVTGGNGAYVGGVAGYNHGGAVTSCYYNSDATQTVDSMLRTTKKGVDYGTDASTGETSAFMKSSDFVTLLSANTAANAACYLWEIDSDSTNGGYPVFIANWTDSADSSWYNSTHVTFTITTPQQLAGLISLVNGGNNLSGKTIILGSDINLAGKEWTPIGSGTADSFKGIFNGAGYKITNLTIGTSGSANSALAYLGLFGYADSGSTIENVGVDATIYSSKLIASVGELAGYDCGAVENSYATGNVTGGNYTAVGGLVGYNEGDDITNCYATGNVTGGTDAYVGGIMGFNDGGTITTCYYNSNSTQIVASTPKATAVGVGSGTDASTVETLSFMKSTDFVKLLNNNIGTNTDLSSWASDSKTINSGYPVLVAITHAPTLATTVTSGTASLSTQIAVTDALGSGDTLAYKISSSSITAPNVGDAVSGTTAYTSGGNIGDVTEGQYVAVYELDGSSKAVKCTVTKLTAAEINAVSVAYSAYMQSSGWQTNSVTNGKTAGTTGSSLRLEALKIELDGEVPEGESIIYQAHVQSIGWQTAATDGEISGTTGKSKRIEAIRITLAGLSGYEVKYRAYVQSTGWTDWQTTKNGTAVASASVAGTTGKSLKVEAVQIVVEKTAS